jgi:RHS repeat-associated protein
MSDLPVTTVTYTAFNAVRVKTETVGTTTRTTTTTYDAAARPVSVTVSGGTGQVVADTETTYTPDTGAIFEVCQPSCASTNPRLSRAYDDFGRLTAYTDSNGTVSTTTYDVASRPVQPNDGKATQTRTYDGTGEKRGVVTQLVDSVGGTFTATYDVTGSVAAETYPNGIVATSVRDEVGATTQLAYDQPGCTATDCTWFTDSNVESIHGQVLDHSGLSAQTYTYDRAGRLTRVEDHADGVCTVRAYTLDADSNRTQLVETAYDDTCTTQTSTSSLTSYVDSADRLYAVSPRTTNDVNDYGYDAYGRITRVPSTHAQLPTAMIATYYVDDVVRSISSGATTRTWSRDPSGRLAGWTDGDPASGMTHVNHFDGDDDSPSWTTETADGSSYTRAVSGIGSGFALQSSSGSGTTVTLQLTNLHGDVAVTASSSATEPATPLATAESTEFGTPRGGIGTGPRYGWLGAKQRSADTPSGVILMGVRLYLPTIGRFLQVDPVSGGSASVYDYANADPVNGFDLDGRWPHIHWKKIFRNPIFQAAVTIAACSTGVACAAVSYGFAAYNSYNRFREHGINRRTILSSALDFGLAYLDIKTIKPLPRGGAMDLVHARSGLSSGLRYTIRRRDVIRHVGVRLARNIAVGGLGVIKSHLMRD